MVFLLRHTLFRAVTIALAMAAAGEIRAESSFSTVVIDPGHGGFDRGGIPGQQVPEKMVALDTALRLQKLLQTSGIAHRYDAVHRCFCSAVCAERDRQFGARRSLC